MTTILIIAENHMDPVWKRCFRRPIDAHGVRIRPYAELEALAFDAWFDLCRQGARYGIETTLVLREYLERRPERQDEVIRMVRDGVIEIYGGGEAVVDYNLADGETIVRSHTQAIRWCVATFGRRPVVGFAPDTFGLSAQVPQIFRGLGYRSLMRARLMDSGRPYWRGLDGSTVFAGRNVDLYPGRFQMHGAPIYTAPAACCAGIGCTTCQGTGLDLSPRLLDGDEATRLDAWMAALDQPEALIYCMTEELLPPPDLLTRLDAMARAHGHRIRWATQVELLREQASGLLTNVDAAHSSDRIDPRPEINPLFTGCYLSRNGIKRTVRALESDVRSAEALAALAWSHDGAAYAGADLDRCWRDLALLAFHDALPGSHSDPAFDELMDIADGVRAISRRIATTAATVLAGGGSRTTVDRLSLAVFLPVTGNRDGDPIDLVIPQAATWPGVAVTDDQGRTLPVIAWQPDGHARIAGLDLPAFGWQTLSITREQPLPVDPCPMSDICSPSHQVTVAPGGLAITDLRLGRTVLAPGACGLWVEEDIGSTWETLSEPSWRIDLDRQPGVATTAVRGQGWTRVERAGELNDRLAMADRRVRRLSWRMAMTLHDHSDRIDLTVDIDWDSEDCRVFLALPLPWTPAEGRATYGIPFGLLERRAYAPQPGRHGCTNGDWPVLGMVAAHDPADDTWVAVLERGNPAAQVVGPVLRIGLMRSPTHATLGSQIAGARDAGQHRFELALITGQGTPQALHLVERARAFNSTPVTVDSGQPTSQPLLTMTSAPAPVASCLKQSDDGTSLVLRVFDPYGGGAGLDLAGPLATTRRQVDLVEEPVPGAALRLAPHQIASLRLDV